MSRRRSVLILIIDALRARNVSCYGYPVTTTPHLDAFARHNARFKHAYTSATWTIPSHASMLSGLYLSQHRLENIDRNRRFHDSIVPLPSALSAAGYRTAGFSQNPLFAPRHHFDYFDEFFEKSLLQSHWLSNWWKDHLSAGSGLADQMMRYLDKVIRPRLLFDALHDWIREHDDDTPFFAMVNVLNVHYPWAPPLPLLLRRLPFPPTCLMKREYVAPSPWAFDSRRQRVTQRHRAVWQSLYDAAVLHVDRELGRFLQRLSRWRGWRDMILVITSDHGDMLGDYRDLVGHMLSLHDNVMHVPLIVRHPAYPAGIEVEGVVQTLDLYPSVVEWADLCRDSIPAAQLQRPSYSQAMESPHDPSGYAFAEEDFTDSYHVIEGLLECNPAMDPHRYPRRQLAVHSATHKYIWFDDRPGEFYDLRRDPLETRNLILDNEQMACLLELKQVLERWRSGLTVFPPRSARPAQEVDPEVLDRLRGLGYLE
jgi:arylsulfatase A-like enzyme